MATTFTLIGSVTVGAGGASSIDFSSIPSTYTDLCLKTSIRYSGSIWNNLDLKVNNVTTNMAARFLEGAGSGTPSSFSASTGSNDPNFIGYVPGTNVTASTFTNTEIYFPNYAGSNAKSYSVDAVAENNATTSYMHLAAVLWNSSSAINQITIVPPSGTFVQYSTAYLYGVNNA
jgi:hypothetical protein